MISDFDMIVKKLPETQKYANIYAIGDTQVGSSNFDEKLFMNWRDRVVADPFGLVVLVGDMLNNGLKTSKTNVYREVMHPSEAKKWLAKELAPLSGKIIGAVTGNHEQRSINGSDDCPLYDIMAKLDLEHLYRENLAFIKLNLGLKQKGKQVSYMIGLAHGVGGKKTKAFPYAVEGLDLFITGHTHDPQSAFPARIVPDMHNETVRIVGFTHIIVPSFDTYGGYVARGLFLPQDSTKIPVVILDGSQKKVEVSWKQEKS